MRIKNPFFKKKNNIYIGDIFNILNLKKPKNNFKVDNISDLNSGIYFVRIKNGDYYVTKKLIIN